MRKRDPKMALLCTAVAVACLAFRPDPAQAAEVKPMSRTIVKIFGRALKTNIGFEIHLSHDEAKDVAKAALVIAAEIKHPIASAAVLAAGAVIKLKDKGAGVIVEVLYTGQVVGVKSK